MNPRSPWPRLMLAERLSSAMPAFSSVCAIWARRTSAFVSRSVLSGEITPSSIRRSMYPRSTPDRLAASAREYSATRPGYGARTAGVITQGFSTCDVTRLEILVIAVDTCPVGPAEKQQVRHVATRETSDYKVVDLPNQLASFR